MLTRQPEVGEFVEALCDGYWDGDWGDQYQTIGKIYKIVGRSEVSGNPYFICDTDQALYIDRESWFMYKLIS